MIFKRKSKLNKALAEYEWQDWFAWYPVKIDENTTVWLKKIQRVRTIVFRIPWYYRLKEKHAPDL